MLFVIDTSGSMAETTAVDGRLELRGAEQVSAAESSGMRPTTKNRSRLSVEQRNSVWDSTAPVFYKPG